MEKQNLKNNLDSLQILAFHKIQARYGKKIIPSSIFSTHSQNYEPVNWSLTTG